jgi:cytochrome b involved in lipid metabolism
VGSVIEPLERSSQVAAEADFPGALPIRGMAQSWKPEQNLCCTPFCIEGFKLHKSIISLVATAALLWANTAWSQVVVKTPLSAEHPLVGDWRIDVSGTNCHEIYSVRADGTMRVTSGSQQAESEFEISSHPSASGFYKWVDKIVKDNGRPDCMGEIMEVGHVATNFIRLHPTGTKFLMCEAEDINTCIGPFVRENGI